LFIPKPWIWLTAELMAGACGLQTPAAPDDDPGHIVLQSAGSLERVRQVTVDWEYHGYKGSYAKGRTMVTPTGVRTISGPSVGRLTLVTLAQAVKSVTDLPSCPRLFDDHAVRGRDTTVGGRRVMQVMSAPTGELLLAADQEARPLPRLVRLCIDGPFQRGETGDTVMRFSGYRL
jgi:hypothetical protein